MTEGVIVIDLRMKSTPLRRGEMVQALRVLMRSARAGKGFVAGWLDFDTEEANSVHYEERWRTREDFEDQLRSPRVTHLLALMESASEQPSLEFHFVTETRGLEYVAAVRGEQSTFTGK